MAGCGIYVIGIAGASGSGKSYIAQKIYNAFGQNTVVLLQDNYYKDLSHLSVQERSAVNFDHPDAIEFDLFEYQLKELIDGNTVLQPVYDFKIHNRRKHVLKIFPAKIIIVEGTLIFTSKNLRNLLNLKIYVDTSLDLCFIRRLSRDCQQRGRSLLSVVNQYLDTVRPMYLKYINPTCKYADFILNGDGNIDSGMKQIIHYIDGTLKRKVN